MVDLELGPSPPHLHSRAELSQIYIALLIFFSAERRSFFYFWSSAAGKFTAKLEKICLTKKIDHYCKIPSKNFFGKNSSSAQLAQLAQQKKWVSSARSAQLQNFVSSARSAQEKFSPSSAQLSSAFFFKIYNSVLE